MKYTAILLSAAALALPNIATAQEVAPDGSRAIAIEPYVGVLGGYEDFDSDNDGPITTNCNPRSGCPDGGFVEGVAGVNVPFGPVFVGVEGTAAKGFSGLDYQFGAYGRAGVRAGDSGLVYVKGGRAWIRTDDKGRNDNWSYGMGVEVGPKDIGLGGLTHNPGIRLRLEMTTYDLHSIRPAAGVVFHF